jgi:hypothetical protein
MSTTTRTAASLRELMAQAIDYAGLFPPASLEMSAALRKYVCYRRSVHSWALGTFVIPASRLEQFRSVQQQLNGEQGEAAPGPSLLSVVLSSNLAAELAAVQAFPHGLGVVGSIEARISQPEEISFIARRSPPQAKLFFEIAPERAAELLPALHRGGFCAKLRMGGTVPEAFPCADTVAAFLLRCAEVGVPLKATAGLHHPLRRVAPLTYQPNSAKTTMYGFLNFFTAAAIAWRERQVSAYDRDVLHRLLVACLNDTEPTDWQFSDEALTWSGGPRPVHVERDALKDERLNFVLSFGSCSFEEPIEELRLFEFL